MKSPDPSDDDLTDLLSEIRLLFPGTQILVAFLIILPFNSGYTRVSSLDNAVYVVMFVCAMISLLMFIAPAAQHRLALLTHFPYVVRSLTACAGSPDFLVLRLPSGDRGEGAGRGS